MCHLTMHVTVVLCHLTSYEPQRTRKTLTNMAAVFAWDAKTHSGPLANNNLSCSWNNSYCALWAYVSCHVYFSVLFSKRVLKKNASIAALSFWQWGIGGDYTFPQPRFLPRKGLRGSVNLLSYSADVFHISHGSTSTFVALPSFVTISLDSMSAGLLWLGTLSIQTGKLNRDSISNMEFKSLSLSVLADQLLRKAPRTDSLSVNNRILWTVALSCQHLKAHKTANISWLRVDLWRQ